jgi:hypothetical protein
MRSFETHHQTGTGASAFQNDAMKLIRQASSHPARLNLRGHRRWRIAGCISTDDPEETSKTFSIRIGAV